MQTQTAIGEFRERVQAKVDGGMDRQRAISAVVKEDPDLHDRVLAEGQPKRMQPRARQDGPAVQVFNELVAEHMTGGRSRREAIAAAVKAAPDLHKSMLAEVNAGR